MKFDSINQFTLHSSTCLVLQSSRAFKAKFTISTKTGRTTHSDFGRCRWTLLIDDSGGSRWVGCGDELGVMIWIRFCLLDPWQDFSVCLLHKFKFCEFSMCFNRQSSCCWFVNEMNLFHWKKEIKRRKYFRHLVFGVFLMDVIKRWRPKRRKKIMKRP